MVKEGLNKLTIYYDGACSLCRNKMDWLRQRDKHQKLEFVDISSSDFHDARVSSISRIELNTSLHLRKSDGTFLKDLDAIHLAYRAIGLGWMTAPIRIIGIRNISDWIFAQWKKRIRTIPT